MSNVFSHRANSVFLSCIDDRLVAPDAAFIAADGGAFHARIAGGGGALAIGTEAICSVVLGQITAAYTLGGVTKVYLQSHTDCGAYRLAGVKFDSSESEIHQLYQNLDLASTQVRQALEGAGADTEEIVITLRVVDPSGKLQE